MNIFIANDTRKPSGACGVHGMAGKGRRMHADQRMLHCDFLHGACDLALLNYFIKYKLLQLPLHFSVCCITTAKSPPQLPPSLPSDRVTMPVRICTYSSGIIIWPFSLPTSSLVSQHNHFWQNTGQRDRVHGSLPHKIGNNHSLSSPVIPFFFQLKIPVYKL